MTCWIACAMSSTTTHRPGGHQLRVIPCGLSIHSDPRLLEQMLRNLAVERTEIHQARQGPARLSPPSAER